MVALQLLRPILLSYYKTYKKNIFRLLFDLNKPPNILWLDKNKFFQYFPRSDIKLLIFYEILKQLIFWLKRILIIKKFLKYKKKYQLPLLLFFKASIINSFSFKEVNFWYKNKINTWDKLVELRPESLTKSIHFIKRKGYRDQCYSSIGLLQDKSKLLKIVPKKYQPEFQVLDDNYIKIKDYYRYFLKKDGLILKPNFGSRSRDIYHIYERKKDIRIKKLFTNNSEFLTSKKNFCNLNYDIKKFKNKNNIDEKLILMPYLMHSNYLPKSNLSIVFRAISKTILNNKKLYIKAIWIELFDKSNGLNFINDKKLLFNPNNPSKKIQELEKEFSFNFDSNEIKRSFKKISEASLELHSLLPPINEVAWDWIQTDKQIILLEGNSQFSLCPLKYFHINRKSAIL